MAIPNEDISKNNENIIHRRDCIYFSSQDLSDSRKKTISLSPNKRLLSLDDTEEFKDNSNPTKSINASIDNI